MSLICIGRFPYPEGMASTKRVQHFLDAFQSAGQDVSVLLLGTPPWPGQEKKGNFKEIPYQVLPIGNSNWKRLLSIPMIVLLVRELLVKRKSMDAHNTVYIYDGINFENFALAWLARKLGYKVVVDIVEDYTSEPGTIGWGRKLNLKFQNWSECHLHQLVDGVVVISTYLETKLRKQTQNKVPIALISIATKIVEGLPERKSDEQMVKFIYSGSFGEKDGVDVLLNAFDKVSARFSNCQLLLSGKGRNAAKYKDDNTNEKVVFVGYLDDKSFYQFLAEGDAMCMTRIESQFANAGFPFKLGEYLATGKPVIASEVGDVGHYLSDKENALLVQPGDSATLQKAMEFVLTRPSEAAEIGMRGREACKRHFSAEKNGKMLLNFINSLH